MRSTEWNPPRSVIGRGLSLLRCFKPADTELSLAELSLRSRLPKPTVHRLLGELESWGAIERTGRGFRLGLWLFEVGQLVPRQRGIQEAAMPLLGDLHEATHETVHLAVPDGIEVVYLVKMDAQNGPAIPSRVGGRMPLYCTGVGKAVLAESAPDVMQAVLERGLTRRTPYTQIMPGLLGKELATIRETGVAYEREESALGLTCAASAIVDASGHPIAAISITGWINRFDTARFGPAVRTAALAISRQLSAGG